MGGVEDDDWFINWPPKTRNRQCWCSCSLILKGPVVGYCHTKVMYNVVHQKGHNIVPLVLHHSGSDLPENVTGSLLGHTSSQHLPEMAALVNFTLYILHGTYCIRFHANWTQVTAVKVRKRRWKMYTTTYGRTALRRKSSILASRWAMYMLYFVGHVHTAQLCTYFWPTKPWPLLSKILKINLNVSCGIADS